jgi:TetR/AcrR family transcriptional regulator, ethionamide resistance regulator
VRRPRASREVDIVSKPRSTSAAASSLYRKNRDAHSSKAFRRRRSPRAAEIEILDAAERFLKEHPFREMSVDNVMAGTGLSRPSFYEYFHDRHDLIMKLSERLGEMTYIVGQHTWLSGGDSGNEPIEALRNGVQELIDLYSKRGYLLRAISDAAVTDRAAENAYREMIARYIEVTATRIRLGIRNGAIKNVNAKEIATALVLFNNGYLIEKFGREPQADRKVTAETLLTIWKRVLYRI